MSSKETAKEKEWRQSISQAQQGDKAAKEWLLEQNTGLIYMVLKRFAGRGHDMEELFQVGAIGLIHAIERFDLEKDFAFSTYAVPLIIGEIQRFLRDDNMIHMSRSMKENGIKIAAIREKWRKTKNCDPTLEQLMQESGLGKEEVLAALEVFVEVDSIDRPVAAKSGGDNGSHLRLGDQIPDERCSNSQIINKIAVEQLLERLEEKERKLIELRYMAGATQTQTAEALGMNQVAVSRLEKKILRKLRLMM